MGFCRQTIAKAISQLIMSDLTIYAVKVTAMYSIARRVEKLEKIISAGKERKIREYIFSLLKTHDLENWQELRDKLGPVENWLTYKEQLATAREDQADREFRVIMINLSVEKELQARELMSNAIKNNEKQPKSIKSRKVG
jgi:hypothetical protein